MQRSCPSELVFPPYIKNCGKGESLGITICPKTVLGGKQGHAVYNVLSLQQSLFCVCHISWRSYDCHRVEVSMATISFVDITGHKKVVSVCLSICCSLVECSVNALKLCLCIS